MDTSSTVRLSIEVGVGGTDKDAPHGRVVRVCIIGDAGIGEDGALTYTFPR